jgi:hypothetical protein
MLPYQTLPPNARFDFLHLENDAPLFFVFISSRLDFVNCGQNQACLSASFLASHLTPRFRLGPAFGFGTKWHRQDDDCAEASSIDYAQE